MSEVAIHPLAHLRVRERRLHEKQPHLVPGRADHQVHVRTDAGLQRVDGSGAQQVVVHARMERHACHLHHQWHQGLALGFDDPLPRNRTRVVTMEGIAVHLGDAVDLSARARVVGRAALHDRTLEQPRGARRGQEVQHGTATRGLAGDGDVACVATEGTDVRLDPAQCALLIAQPAVGVTDAQESERTHAVADGHDHQVATLREARAVDGGITRRPTEE